MKTNFGWLTAMLFVLLATSVYGQEKDGGVKNHFHNIEVQDFDIGEGVTFPSENIKPMMEEIASKLSGLKKFRQVLRTGDTPASADGPTIQLVGTVTKYQPGSRAKRYVISMGAGKTRIVTHIKFLDKATGKLLYEGDASGAVSWGLFGGSSKESLSGVGKKIAKIAKKQFF